MRPTSSFKLKKKVLKIIALLPFKQFYESKREMEVNSPNSQRALLKYLDVETIKNVKI